jgi:hypothetical protein
MACYTDIVGIRGLCDNAEVKYYVDDYGISLKTAASLSDERYVTGRQMFMSKLSDAWEQLKQDVVIKGFKSDQILKSWTISNTGGQDVTGGIQKVAFGIDDRCELTGIFIQSLHVDITAATGVTSITINGVEVYSGSPTVGMLKIAVNKMFSSQIEISVDLTNITVNNGRAEVYTNGAQGCSSTIANSYGISIVADYRCDMEQYLCRFPDKIGRALLLKTAAMMYKEMMYTSKLAEILFVKDKETIMTEIAYLDSSMNLYAYEDKVNEPKVKPGKYQEQIEYLNRVLPAPKCPCCVQCVGSFYSISIP